MKNKILSILKSNDDYISGEQISEILGISRSAVWKYIKKLRSEGYEIDSVTNRGYKIIFSPDIISAELIQNNVKTDFCAKNVHYYDEVDSTNIAAKQNSSQPDGTLFIADIQTAGRGRLGRRWLAPKGCGIWMSLLLKPEIELADVPQITLISGMAVCSVLNSMLDLGAKIKWPNDIVVGSKKICGILTELSADTDGVSYVVPGIGINVNNESFDEELAKKATSVYIETGSRADRCEIVCRIMEEFEKYYKILLSKGFLALREEYRRMCVNIGREVLVIKNNISSRAHCTDIAENGNLIVEKDGESIQINSGEVSVRGIYDYV